VTPGRSSTRSSQLPPELPVGSTVIAIFGPTAAGKSAVADVLRKELPAQVVSADSAALYEGLPVLTAAPGYPARLVGVVPLHEDVSVGRYQRLAHSAVDSILSEGEIPVVVGGTGLYLRAALSALELPPPPPPGARARWGGFYDERGPEEAHDHLCRIDPDAAARVHPNDRRRVVRALELAEAGASLVPPRSRLWSRDVRHPTMLVGIDAALELLDARIGERTTGMADRGAADEARAAWAGPLSATARKVLGLQEFATLPLDEAVTAVGAATRRLARYQRKWLRRLPLDATLDGTRLPEEIAAEIVTLARAGKRLSHH
jgi:tRNA dimethylallyltransferase